MRISRKDVVWFIYFITFTFMLLDTTDNVPATNILRLAKYAFIALMLYENVFVIRFRSRVFFSPVFFMSLILLHTFLFGLVIVNPSVKQLTMNHFQQMITYLSFSFLAARYCFWSDSKKEFLIATTFSFIVFLGWCYITHMNGLAPIRYTLGIVNIIRDESRYGFTFGTIHRSLTGNYGSMAIIFLTMCWYYRKQFSGLLWKYHQVIALGAHILFYFILISAASRGEMLVAFLFFFFIAGIQLKQIIGSKRVKFIINILVMMVAIAGVYALVFLTFAEGSASNRTDNWSVNYDIFKEVGRYFTGMGYIEQHGFLERSYGFETWPCDVYYLYIFFSTGIIGSVLIGGALIFLSARILLNNNTNPHVDIPMKALVLVMLFNNVFHCTIISYSYLTGIPVMILFVEQLYAIDFKALKKEKRMIEMVI